MRSDANEIAGVASVGLLIGMLMMAIITYSVMAIDPVKVLAEPTGQAVECHAQAWPACIAKACPNGFTINGLEVVSCKPASAPCPFPRDAGATE